MVTKLEEEFFKCFGIERKRNNKVTLEAFSDYMLVYKLHY